MEHDQEQDLLNVLKYNKDRLNSVIENTEKAIADIDKTLSQSKHGPYDFSVVDTNIAESLALLEKYSIKKPSNKKENYIPKEYKSIVLEGVHNQSFEELVKESSTAGYVEVKIEDILSPEEIADADARYKEIEDKFAAKTKLKKKDIIFLVTAIALQCVRQYVFTAFEERVSAEEAAKKVPQGTVETSLDRAKLYYVPMSEILSNKKVPYDTIAGSKDYNLGGDGKGLSGNTHRFRTLGHDPILGYVFGTSNILTNTLTDWRAQSYHIKYMPNAIGVQVPTIAMHADTAKMFTKVFDRFKTDKLSIAAAITKQYWHIKSDISTEGLPIPFLSTISPELSQTLAEYGADSIALKEVAEQAGGAMLINFVISTIHGLMYDEKKDGNRKIYEVRTRKILLYSNLIASVSNLIVVGIGVAAGAASENPEVIKKTLRYLDVGGLIVTIGRLFSDFRFITKIKDEFINMELDKGIQKEIDDIDSILNELNGKVFK